MLKPLSSDNDLGGPILFVVCLIAMLLALPVAGWLGRRDVRKFLENNRRDGPTKQGKHNGEAALEANELPLDPQLLSLELQRSLDYYESHFDETAIADLFIAPAGTRANLLAAELGASTGLRISMFNIHDLVDVSFSAEIPDGWLPCMAIGAAMRARPA